MSSLDELKKRIYKPAEEFKERQIKEGNIKNRNTDNAPKEWEEDRFSFNSPEELEQKPNEIMAEIKRKKRRKIILLSALFTVMVIFAAGFLAYKFYIKGGGLGFLSMENIDIAVEIQEKINAGDKFFIPVKIKNNNDIDLESVVLTIEYPEGAEPVNSGASESLKETRDLGNIYANGEAKESFEAFIFGEEGVERNFKLSLEYRLKDSSAIFEKTAEKKVVISQPAASIFIETPREVSSGKEMNFKVEVVSNTAAALQNIVLDLEYPEGFEFISSDPLPAGDGVKRWTIGDIASGEKRSFTIKGRFQSESFSPEKDILATAGVLGEEGEMIVYNKKSASFAIKKPFLDIAFRIRGKESDYISRENEEIRVMLDWQNNLPISVKNAVIEAKITGGENVVNLPEILIDNGGSYRSFDNTIVWDSSNFPKFAYLSPGEKGEVNFSLKIKKDLPIKNEVDKNFKIDLGSRFFTSYVPDEYKDIDISGDSEISIKIVSRLQFSQKGFYSIGAFKNTGPIPPKVGKETTYTIKWSLVNSSNNLSNMEVSAVLPQYMKWVNKTAYNGNIGQLYYNEEAREIKWTMGTLKAGAGVIFPAEEASFQVLFLPAETHIGSSPVLINKASARGNDDFVNVILEDSENAVTTELGRNDPAVSRDGHTVVR